MVTPSPDFTCLCCEQNSLLTDNASTVFCLICTQTGMKISQRNLASSKGITEIAIRKPYKGLKYIQI